MKKTVLIKMFERNMSILVNGKVRHGFPRGHCLFIKMSRRDYDTWEAVISSQCHTSGIYFKFVKHPQGEYYVSEK